MKRSFVVVRIVVFTFHLRYYRITCAYSESPSFAQKEDSAYKTSKWSEYKSDMKAVDWQAIIKDINLINAEIKILQNENINLRFRVEELETQLGKRNSDKINNFFCIRHTILN